MVSLKPLSALWSDQPFGRHWAVSLCAPLEKVGMHMPVSAICRRHVYVDLMRRCNGVVVDPVVHRIHLVYILLVKI